MGEVFIVEAVRSPLGRRNGGLSTVHPADLLGSVQRAAIDRAGLDPAACESSPLWGTEGTAIAATFFAAGRTGGVD